MRASLRILLLSAILLSGLVPPMITRAQAGPGVLEHRVDVFFPSAIRFEVRLEDSAAQLTAATLTASQRGVVLVRGLTDAALADSTGTDDELVLRYDWPVPPDAFPALFEEISYSWQVLYDSGDTFDVQGTTVFAPGGSTWREHGDSPLTFFVADSSLNLEQTRDAVVPAYERMAEHTGLRPGLRVVVLPRGFSFCETLLNADGSSRSVVSGSGADDPVACSEAQAEAVLQQQGYVVLYRQQPGLLPFQDEVVAVLFDAFYQDYWDARYVPAWFLTGLARYYRVNGDPLAVRQMRAAARVGGTFVAGELSEAPADSVERQAWEVQAYTMVLHLAARFGAQAPFTLAQEARTVSFDEAFEALTGITLPVFLAQWERWLFTDEAEGAAGWTVYLSATVTPLPTHTLTSTPSAVTQMATVVASTELPAAASEADTSLPTAALLPTRSFTTSVPVTPTNTPRPPGSLDRNVPVPESEANSGNSVCPAALPTLVLPIMAVGIFQRRKKQL